nr:hypothetical protein [Moritella viscosa]
MTRSLQAVNSGIFPLYLTIIIASLILSLLVPFYDYFFGLIETPDSYLHSLNTFLYSLTTALLTIGVTTLTFQFVCSLDSKQSPLFERIDQRVSTTTRTNLTSYNGLYTLISVLMCSYSFHTLISVNSSTVFSYIFFIITFLLLITSSRTLRYLLPVFLFLSLFF